MSAHKLSKDFNVSLEEAQDFIDKFFLAYPELKKLFKSQTEAVLSKGYVIINDFTRRRSYGGDVFDTYQSSLSVIEEYKSLGLEVSKKLWSKLYTARGILERMSNNYPIQGEKCPD